MERVMVFVKPSLMIQKVAVSSSQKLNLRGSSHSSKTAIASNTANNLSVFGAAVAFAPPSPVAPGSLFGMYTSLGHSSETVSRGFPVQQLERVLKQALL